MKNLLKSIFKQKKVELVPTDNNWFEPIRIDGGWAFKLVPDFFDE